MNYYGLLLLYLTSCKNIFQFYPDMMKKVIIHVLFLNNDAVEYLVIGSMDKCSYALISVWNDEYKIELIPY